MFSKKTMKMFEAKYHVNEDTGCWKWTASCARNGYGQFMSSVKDGRMWYRAHRFSYLAHKGDIPAGMVVMHICDNPGCVNPDHLTVGSQAENIRDRDKKGRGFLKAPPTGFYDVKNIQSSSKTDSELAAEIGCSPGHIWKIRNDRYAWMKVVQAGEVV